MIDHITSLETVIALLVLLAEMILINFQGCIQRDIQILEHELVIPMDMINLLVATTFPIEVLDAINMVLSPNSLQSHIFLIMDHQANHLKQHIQVLNNFFNYILTMGITVPICILVIGLMMMISSPLFIQHGIDYYIVCLLVKLLLYLKKNNFLLLALS